MYKALFQGSSYLVMGSLYEPFGAATEAYGAGMPVVARATGGLLQQVCPHSEGMGRGYLGEAIFKCIYVHHAQDAPPTGLLYREKPIGFEQAAAAWQQMGRCGYWQQNPKADRLAERKSSIQFKGMVEAATGALDHAIEIYQKQPLVYAGMIYSGYRIWIGLAGTVRLEDTVSIFTVDRTYAFLILFRER